MDNEQKLKEDDNKTYCASCGNPIFGLYFSNPCGGGYISLVCEKEECSYYGLLQAGTKIMNATKEQNKRMGINKSHG